MSMTVHVIVTLLHAVEGSVPTVTDDGIYTVSTSQLHSTWISADSESGIAEYQYAIGTTVGGTDMVNWTSTGTTASVTKTGLSLTPNQVYYISVKAKNGVGQWSTIGSSDGITVVQIVSLISQAKSYPDGTAVKLTDKPASAKIGSAFWIEESDRSSGIKVNSGISVSPGDLITVGGKLSINQGERFLDAVEVAKNGSTTAPEELALVNKMLGGADLNSYTPGVKDGAGANNIGLLVKVWGKVTQMGTDYFYINDGSGLKDGSSTDTTQNVGIRILTAPGTLNAGDFVIITGVSSTFDISSQHIRAVLPITSGVQKL